MKRLTSIFLALTLMLSAAACESKDMTNSQDNSSEIVNSEHDVNNKLTNHMTDKERENVKVGELTVFDHEQKSESDIIPKDGVYLEIWTPEYQKEYWEQYMEENPSDENAQEVIDSIDEENVDRVHVAYVDGLPVYTSFPSPDYDGGEITIMDMTCFTTDGVEPHYYDENLDEITAEEVEEWTYDSSRKKTYSNFEEYKSRIRKEVEILAELGLIEQSDIEQEYERVIRVWEAIIDKSYKELSAGSTEEFYNVLNHAIPVWEIDHDATEEIAEFVSEISIYDEELDSNFIVHVTLPPDYDPEKTYPAYVLTDGVWRFGNHPALRKAMENKESGDALLVSIGYDYSVDGMDDQNRIKYFCDKSKEFLDFITDNLMPYLGEQYNVDFSNSTIYGHSLGGTFTHYAVFNSDRYENQPFGNYIIGSPAFWSPGFLPYVDISDCKNEYGYFDRNDTLEKRIFICAGADEDPVYEEYYGDNDSTLEGVENLTKRLTDYGFTNFECKLYPDSEHYQFIPEMLVEVLEKFYPCCSD